MSSTARSPRPPPRPRRPGARSRRPSGSARRADGLQRFVTTSCLPPSHHGRFKRPRLTKASALETYPGALALHRVRAADDGAVRLAELTATSQAVARPGAQGQGRGPGRVPARDGARRAPRRGAVPGRRAAQGKIGVGWALLDAPARAGARPRSSWPTSTARGALAARSRDPARAGPAPTTWARCSRAPPTRPAVLLALSSASCARARWRASWPRLSRGRPRCRRDAVRRACMLGGDLGATAPRRSTGGAAALRRSRSTSSGRCCRCWRRRPTTSTPRWRRSAPAAGRVQARRRPRPGPQARRRGPRLHPRPQRRHRARCPRSSRPSLALPARDVCSTARPSRCARRPAAPVPGHDAPVRHAPRRRRRARAPAAVLRPAARRRRRPDRSARPRARRRARRLVRPAAGSRALVTDAAEARAFLDAALAAGHEGVMAKALDAPYAAGRRGALAQGQAAPHARPGGAGRRVGHGRRRGWLSQPAPRRARSGGRRLRHARQDVQGPHRRDAGLADRAPARARGRAATTDVHVRPELVAEIAFNDVQACPRYPAASPCASPGSGYRPDKSAAEADTIETLRALHAGGL